MMTFFYSSQDWRKLKHKFQVVHNRTAQPQSDSRLLLVRMIIPLQMITWRMWRSSRTWCLLFIGAATKMTTMTMTMTIIGSELVIILLLETPKVLETALRSLAETILKWASVFKLNQINNLFYLCYFSKCYTARTNMVKDNFKGMFNQTTDNDKAYESMIR